MAWKLTTNRKILVGVSVQLTAAFFYLVSIISLRRVSLPIGATYLFFVLFSGILVSLGIFEEKKESKSTKLSPVTNFPEAH